MQHFMISKNHQTLIVKATKATSYFLRLKGLLGKSSLAPQEAIILEPCTSIHTFFMKFAIDAIFLNSENRIIALYSNLKPNRVTKVYWHAKRVVETQSGFIHSFNLREGDILCIN